MNRIPACLLGLTLLATSCAAPPQQAPADAEIARQSSSAQEAYARGAYPQAARHFAGALERSRVYDDGPEIARNAYNLAACYVTLGRPLEARALLREALKEFTRSGLDCQPVLLLDARAAAAAGTMDEAKALLDRAGEASRSDAARAEVWLVRGELAANEGDVEGARKALRAAQTAVGKADKLGAAGEDLAGRVLTLGEEPKAACRHFDAAADAWRKAGQPRDMAAALGRAGDAYLQAGDAAAAAERFYRAARSFQAQGDAVGGLQRVQRGLEANRVAADPELEALLTTLFEEIRASIQKGSQTQPLK